MDMLATGRAFKWRGPSVEEGINAGYAEPVS
jgi:hypothetical protein